MVDILVVLFGVTLISLAVITMMDTYVKVLAVQGFLLFLIILFSAGDLSRGSLLFAAIETIGFKAILVPAVMLRTIRDNEITREIQPNVPQFVSILIISLMTVFGFLVAFWANAHTKYVQPLHFGIAVSTVLSGLFLILARKKLISHLIGYMIVENGTFLLSLAVAKDMPIIVTLGVSLDIFIGVLLAGIVIKKITSTFEDGHIDDLTNLKD